MYSLTSYIIVSFEPPISINFDDDSKDDEDWIKQSEVENDSFIYLMTLQSTGPRKRLPKRRVAPNNLCEDAAGEDLSGDSDW